MFLATDIIFIKIRFLISKTQILNLLQIEYLLHNTIKSVLKQVIKKFPTEVN